MKYENYPKGKLKTNLAEICTGIPRLIPYGMHDSLEKYLPEAWRSSVGIYGRNNDGNYFGELMELYEFLISN